MERSSTRSFTLNVTEPSMLLGFFKILNLIFKLDTLHAIVHLTAIIILFLKLNDLLSEIDNTTVYHHDF